MKRSSLASNTTVFKYFLWTLLAVFIISCSDDDDQGDSNNTQNAEQIRTNMTSGTWRIVLYSDSGVDETNDYDGYTFTFNENGTLQAENNSDTYSGTWSVTNSSSSDDSGSDDDIDFNIAFSAPDILLELTDDWDVDTYSSTRIELFDISGGDNTTDLLTFQKN